MRTEYLSIELYWTDYEFWEKSNLFVSVVCWCPPQYFDFGHFTSLFHREWLSCCCYGCYFNVFWLMLNLFNFWNEIRYYLTTILFDYSSRYLLRRLPVKAFISGWYDLVQHFSIPPRCTLYCYGCSMTLQVAFQFLPLQNSTETFLFFIRRRCEYISNSNL